MTPITTRLMKLHDNDMYKLCANLNITTVTFRSWMENGIPYIKALHVERKTREQIMAEEIMAETLAMERRKK